MGILFVIAAEIGLAIFAFAVRYRIIWPIAVTMVFASLFGFIVYGRPLPRLW